MALERTGLRLVAEGADAYVRDTDRAGDSSDRLTKTLKGVGVAAAGLAGLRFLAGLGKQAIGAVSAHEQLTMSIGSLVAKELRAADTTLSMADALEQASGRSEELLGWIQDLAIKSPFDQQGVAMAFRTALAYGFTSDEAQTLTSSMIDFATATGQNVGVMNQVALALGQIKAKGKLAGGEILQLVNAGFAVNPILEKLGYTLDDVSKGLVSADEFLGEFTSSMQDEFGGAAERSSETLGGLLNSLGDIREMGLRELFGPIIQAALPSLTALVGKMQQMVPVLGMVGRGVGSMTTWLIDNRRTVLAGAAAFGVFFGVLKSGAIVTAVTGGITALTAALGPLIAGVGLLLSPVGLLAGALGLLTFGVIKVMQSFKSANQGIAESGVQISRTMGGDTGRGHTAGRTS